MDSSDILALLGLGGGFVVIGLVEAVKRTAAMPERLEKRVVPLLALLFGVCWNWLVLSYLRADDLRFVAILLPGLQSGLNALGLWSGSKALVESTAKPTRVAPRG